MPVGRCVVMAAVPPLAALGEHVLEQVGAVGEQAVDAAVEELAHLVGVVDGPDVDVLAGGVRPAYQPGGGDGPAPAPVRDLERGDPPPGQPVGEPARWAEAEDARPRPGARRSAPGRR